LVLKAVASGGQQDLDKQRYAPKTNDDHPERGGQENHGARKGRKL